MRVFPGVIGGVNIEIASRGVYYMASSANWHRVSSKVLEGGGGDESLVVVGCHASPFVALHHHYHRGQHSGLAVNGQNQTGNLVNQTIQLYHKRNHYRESVLQAF
jgi:hypothetical protein